MALNVLIIFHSGKKQPLIGVDYSKIQPQLDSKTREGIIADFMILPSDFTECKKILKKEGVEI